MDCYQPKRDRAYIIAAPHKNGLCYSYVSLRLGYEVIDEVPHVTKKSGDRIMAQYADAADRINTYLDAINEGWTRRASDRTREIFDESRREWNADYMAYLDSIAEDDLEVAA